MLGNISGIRLIFFIIFLLVFTVLYYRKILSVKPGESKKIEMIKRVSIILIIIGLLNSLTLTNDPDYKAFILVVVICFINIYNARFIFKHCPSITNEFKITLYIKMSIVIITVAILLRYTNKDGLFSFLYEDASITDLITGDKGPAKKVYTQLKISLEDKLPSYCPDMSDDDYLDEPEWKNLPTPSKSKCSAKQEEVRRRIEVETDMYK